MSSRFNFRPRFDPKKYRWRPVQKEREENQQLEQETMQQQKKEQGSVVGTNDATINAAVVEIVPPRLGRLISFLEKDDSFLSPWSWDCKASGSGASSDSNKGKQYHRFQPGSYFVREYSEFFRPR